LVPKLMSYESAAPSWAPGFLTGERRSEPARVRYPDRWSGIPLPSY